METVLGFSLIGLFIFILLFLVRKFFKKKKLLHDHEQEIILDEKEIAEANWYRFNNLPYVQPTTSLSGILINSFVEDHS